MRDLSGLDHRALTCRLEWMQDAEADVRDSKKLIESVIDEVKPDILHFNQYCYGNISSSVPRIVVAHSDVVSWWVAVHGEEPEATSWISWYRKTVNEGLQGADIVVAPSMWMRDAITQHYSLRTPVRVIYNGRSPHLFEPDHPKAHFALTVGRVWDAGKQIELLKSREHQMPIHVAGSEKEPGSTSPNASSTQVDGEKSQEELRALYARAPIYVATSRYEPFGLAPLEAALSRCALVANDIPVFREVWGDAAYYFRTNDADDLARALRALHTDPAQRKLYGDLAYARARRRFSAQHMVDQYMDLYTALIVQKQAA
jgi:glycosyltransferase involved in cell wall biosynthesis